VPLQPGAVTFAAAGVIPPRIPAPTAALRQWYGHVPVPEFRQRNCIELSTGDAAATVQRLRQLAGERTLTLLTVPRPPEGPGSRRPRRLRLSRGHPVDPPVAS
jgi:hypothetical protein